MPLLTVLFVPAFILTSRAALFATMVVAATSALSALRIETKFDTVRYQLADGHFYVDWSMETAGRSKPQHATRYVRFSDTDIKSITTKLRVNRSWFMRMEDYAIELQYKLKSGEAYRHRIVLRESSVDIETGIRLRDYELLLLGIEETLGRDRVKNYKAWKKAMSVMRSKYQWA